MTMFPSTRPARVWPLFPFVGLALAGVARGQCNTQWLPGPPVAGTDTTVYAITEWDPDGTGPRAPLVVLGGAFTAAGNVPANRIVAYEPGTGTWSALGAGMNDTVIALAVLPSGDLVAGGFFTTAGGGPANRIARWDGHAWSPLGSGTNDHVRALAVLPTGELIAGGSFMLAGGAPANRIARWDGIGWSPLGAGVGVGTVLTLAALQNGDLIAGGSFTTAGGITVNHIARWNGSSWAPLGSGTGLANAWVHSLTVLANGDLVAGGDFSSAGGIPASCVARWNGTAWSAIGAGISMVPEALTTLANGDLIAAGTGIYRWDGVSWSLLEDVPVAYAAARLANGTLVVGGYFGQIGGIDAANVASWDGATWSSLPPGIDVVLLSCVTGLANGEVVGSSGGHGPGITTQVMQWDGTSWSILGVEFPGTVLALATATNGDVIAGGVFFQIGATAAFMIARWDGVTWQPLGLGMDADVNAVLVLPNGDVVAGGYFMVAGGVFANRVARWNGTSWSPIGTGLTNAVHALAVAANGDLVAGGNFSGVSVARWNGNAWVPLGGLGGEVHALAALPNGDIVAGGTTTNGVARWNGTTWTTLAGLAGTNLQIYGLVALPDGDVVATGNFISAGGVPAAGIARWNGSSWSPLATIRSGLPGAMALLANGDFAVARVQRMDGAVSSGFARLTTTCQASAVASGTGCAGSGGIDVLTATSLPWIGSTFRCLASGLPANALALVVFGFATVSIPLPALLPQGVVGCSLMVSPDAIGVLVPAGGAATTELPIPNTATLVAMAVHEQVVTLELGAGGAIVAATATNRITLTIGAF